MSVVLLVVAAIQVLGVVLTIMQVGKPREPISPGIAASVALLNGAMVAFICIAAARLG